MDLKDSLVTLIKCCTQNKHFYICALNKTRLPMQETQVRYLGREDPLKKEMATHPSVLVWKNPMDREAWQATVYGVTEELDTT